MAGLSSSFINFSKLYYSLECFTGGDLERLKTVVGGDQMTRVNLQSAKNLRRGCFTQAERLEHLHPIIMEMFHTLMDFLEVDCYTPILNKPIELLIA